MQVSRQFNAFNKFDKNQRWKCEHTWGTALDRKMDNSWNLKAIIRNVNLNISFISYTFMTDKNWNIQHSGQSASVLMSKPYNTKQKSNVMCS